MSGSVVLVAFGPIAKNRFPFFLSHMLSADLLRDLGPYPIPKQGFHTRSAREWRRSKPKSCLSFQKGSPDCLGFGFLGQTRNLSS